MNSDLVKFEAPKYENANLLLEFCREALQNHGFRGEANRLQDIVVTNRTMAGIALATLLQMQIRGRAREAHTLAVRGLKELISETIRGIA